MTNYTVQDVKKFTRIMGIVIVLLAMIIIILAFANWRMADRLDYQADKIERLQTEIDGLHKERDTLTLENIRLKDADAITQNQLTELEGLREFYVRTTGHRVAEVKEVVFEATRYTNAEGWWPKGSPNYGKTTSGVFASVGTVAAPRSVPFGSTVLLTEPSLKESSEIFTVHDRGGAIKVKDDVICIDIWTHESDIKNALAFGRQKKVGGYLIIPEEDI